MSYKQNFTSQPNSLSGIYPEPNDTDQRKLLRLWNTLQVNENYQNIVLQYLDQFKTQQQLQRQIHEQLKKTYEKDSPFFRIQHLLIERDKTISILFNEILRLQKYKEQNMREQPKLQQTCDIIDHLRKLHMLICEEVHQMFVHYASKSSRKQFVGGFYIHIFKIFDEDIQFLKNSLLKFYMPFSTGFDPLFLEQIKNLKNLYQNNQLVYDRNVEQLFRINASYMYRLLRAQQRMINFITNQQQTQSMKKETHSLGEDLFETERIRPVQKINKLKEKQAFRPKNLLFNTIQQKRKKSSQSNQKIQEDLIIDKSRPKVNLKDACYQINSPERETKLLKYCQQYSINNNDQKRSNIVYSRQANNRISIAQIQDDEVHKNIALPNPSYNSKLKYQFEPKTHKNLSPSLNSVLHEKIPSRIHIHQSQQNKLKDKNLVRSRIKTQKYPKRLDKSSDVTLMKQKPRYAKHASTRYNTSLPPINSRIVESHQEKSDCLCRQRYKQKLQHQHQEDLGQQQVILKRKAIVKDIQLKYKAMIQRETRYQLSKLGDKTYHKMRNHHKKEMSRVTPTRSRVTPKSRVSFADEVGETTHQD